MIEINLIPDVKQDFLRAQRTRNVAISVAILVGIIAVAAVAILGTILVGQKITSGVLDGSIKKKYSEISSEKDLSNLLTIQNQLAKVSDQNTNRSMNSRVFDVLSGVNPKSPDNVVFSNVEVNPEDKTIKLDGSAENSYAAAEALKKTILNTKFAYRTKGDDGQEQRVPLTDEVTVFNTSYGEDASGKKMLRFTLSFIYPDSLFKNDIVNARIETPTGRVDVTDSRTRVPDSLFGQRVESKEGN